MRPLNSEFKNINFLELNCKDIIFLEEDIKYLDELSHKERFVLKYIFMKKEDTKTDSYENHKDIAIAGMLRIRNLICETTFRSVANSSLPELAKGIEMIKNGYWPYFMVEINQNKMSAEKIKCSRFWEDEDYYLKYNSDGSDYGYGRTGYKKAFFSAIHGDPSQKAFNIINDKYLLPFNDDNLEIYSWNDEWSNYFDDGKEYWGTFYWTIYNKEKDMYIVIAGSATD